MSKTAIPEFIFYYLPARARAAEIEKIAISAHEWEYRKKMTKAQAEQMHTDLVEAITDHESDPAEVARIAADLKSGYTKVREGVFKIYSERYKAIGYYSQEGYLLNDRPASQVEIEKYKTRDNGDI